LRGAQLQRANLSGAQLQGSKIAGIDLADAIYDRSTRPPTDRFDWRSVNAVTADEGA
jgi:uncharacterized protein YjbI with pentapeptide repeats